VPADEPTGSTNNYLSTTEVHSYNPFCLLL
jgi:hypothetical protein